MSHHSLGINIVNDPDSFIIKFEAEVIHESMVKVVGSCHSRYSFPLHINHMDVLLQIPAFVPAPEPISPSAFEHEIHGVKHSVITYAHYLV